MAEVKRFFALLIIPVLLLALSGVQARASIPPVPAGANGANAASFVDSGQNLGGDAPSTAVSLGDLDGDGDLDAVVANDDAGPAIWVNDGGLQGGAEGTFTAGPTLGDDAAVALELADLDGDGDLDVFFQILALDDASRVWLNQGGAQGGDEGDFLFSGQDFGYLGVALALGDVNGDGAVDALVMMDNGDTGKVWLNDGNGAFADSGQDVAIPAVDAALADLDGDGDLDLFTVMDGVEKANRVGVNQGGAQNGTAGEFLDSGQRLGDGASSGVALGDVDGDGDVDAFVANSGANRLWLNGGGAQAGEAGVFQGGAELGSGESADAALADLDGDGDLDAFVANSGANLVWINQGGADGGSEGTFADNGQTLGTALSQSVALGDVDGDGDLDAFVANYASPNRVWLNEGPGSDGPRHFVYAASLPVEEYTFSYGLGLEDLDGDGDLDVVVNQGDAYEVIVNDGSATMTSQGPFALGEWSGKGPTLGDFDGDGDPDMLFGGHAAVLVNDGAGNFGDGAPLPAVAREFASGDLDGDGDLDVLALLYLGVDDGYEVQVWINQGGAQGGAAGVFADSGNRFEGVSYGEFMDVGDVDGDGDLDVVYRQQVWLNQGGAQGGQSAAFANSGQVIGDILAWDVALTDADGDGDLDAFIAHRTTEPTPPALWINDGGVFSESGQSFGNEDSDAFVPADVDQDGDLDAVRLGSNGGRIWLNRGGAQGGQEGAFEAGEPIFTPGSMLKAAVGDVDGDGYPDLVGGGGPALWLNRDGAGMGRVGFVHQNLPQDNEGSQVYDWWALSNAVLPVALRQSLSIEREMEVGIAFPFGVSPQRVEDVLRFPPGDVLDYVTAGVEQPGGEADHIWNPYFGADPDYGESVGVEVRLFGTNFLTVDGPYLLHVVFHHPDSALRRCFLEGMEHLIDSLSPQRAMAAPANLPGPVDLDLFRSVRDDVMAETPQGRYYASLYETHSPELLQITTHNLSLLGDVGRGLQTWSPLLEALVAGEGDSATITPAMVEQAMRLLDAYEAEAGPGLAGVIRQEREALDLPSFAGLTMEEALARVNERELPAVYLPLASGR